MTEAKLYPVPTAAAERAWIDQSRYEEWYAESVNNPADFWAHQANEFLDWFEPWHTTLDYDYKKAHIRWFEGGKLNVSFNCLDRHLDQRGDQTAIIWEGDDPSNDRKISYRELHGMVCRFANALKARGVKKGDRVCIYMPMVAEAAVAMLACTRIGAVHTIVFGGFSPEALRSRVEDADCGVVITADEGLRAGKTIPLKANTDAALEGVDCVHTVVTYKRTGGNIAWVEGRDCWYHEITDAASDDCDPEPMDAEDPLFILYTSGSTGKPKGVVHTTGGYLLHAAFSHKAIFDIQDDDIYWCTADVGWITGHTYIVYGPLANGATTVMFEGVPTYPSASRCWEVCDKHDITVFYTAPTALRALMSVGDEAVTKTSRKSLRLLGTVGEPINPEAWRWYHEVIGENRCPIVDTWWQTETGGALLSPLCGATATKPGSATLPFFGVQPALLDEQGNELEGANSGYLVMKHPWPGQARTIYGDHQRFIDTYFSQYPGYYFTGDGARRDEDGYYWITGRVDDVLNISGHRLGTAEIESALVLHEKVAEAAVVGTPHDIKGEAVYAYVTLMGNLQGSDELKAELLAMVTKEIGAIAKPDYIQWAPALPKTRSGKIMRRILRKVAANDLDTLGDTSTLADPGVVDDLIENRLVK